MKLAIHGNCQAGALQDMLGPALPGWDISSFQVHLVANEPASLAHYEKCFAEADAVVCQPVGDGYRDMECLSERWVRATARAAAPVVSVPSLYYHGYFSGLAVLHDAEGVISSYHSHESALPLVAGVLAGDGDDAIVARLMDERMFDRGAVMAGHERALAELERREQEGGLDATVSRFLRERFASGQLFHTYNHPARAVLVHIARQVLAALGVSAAVPEDGYNPFGYYHIPALPTVGATFRETPESSRFFADGVAVDRATHYRQCLADMRQHPVERLGRMFAQNEHLLRWYLP